VISCPTSLVIENHQVTGKDAGFRLSNIAQPKGGLHASGVGQLVVAPETKLFKYELRQPLVVFANRE
jgi:hypothetical protein